MELKRVCDKQTIFNKKIKCRCLLKKNYTITQNIVKGKLRKVLKDVSVTVFLRVSLSALVWLLALE